MRTYYVCAALVILMISCKKETHQVDVLQHIMQSNHNVIQKVRENLAQHEVQLKLSFANKEYNFGVHDSIYFYPASSVKFPIALLALEKAYQWSEISSETPFFIEGDSVTTTIRKEIEKIFAVSDNDAYNRLFEFLGQDYINNTLAEKGLHHIRISHRLSVADAANPTTKEMVFAINDSTLITQEPIINAPIKSLELQAIQKGKGYYKNEQLVAEPMDFSKKNYMSISALHELMQRVHFPKNYNKKERFQFSESDYTFLLQAMSQTPKEAGFVSDKYYDSYVKFFMYGDKKTPIPEHIKIYNKVGFAYGYVTDCAFIKDSKNDISFILTATIHVNENQIFNDDTYEYEDIGIPFLATLGREIHKHLLKKQ